MPDQDDPLDRIFKAVSDDRLKKQDDEYEQMLNSVKDEMPDFLREAVEKGQFIKPSQFAEDPALDTVRQNLLLRAKLDEVTVDFHLAMGLLRAVTATYGTPSEDHEGGHQIFVSDEVLGDKPHCVDVFVEDDKPRKGTVIHTSPSDCDGKHTPGHSVN